MVVRRIHKKMCRERGSNPHESNSHRFLRPTRLPIPPSRLGGYILSLMKIRIIIFAIMF